MEQLHNKIYFRIDSIIFAFHLNHITSLKIIKNRITFQLAIANKNGIENQVRTYDQKHVEKLNVLEYRHSRQFFHHQD